MALHETKVGAVIMFIINILNLLPIKSKLCITVNLILHFLTRTFLSGACIHLCYNLYATCQQNNSKYLHQYI